MEILGIALLFLKINKTFFCKYCVRVCAGQAVSTVLDPYSLGPVHTTCGEKQKFMTSVKQ